MPPGSANVGSTSRGTDPAPACLLAPTDARSQADGCEPADIRHGRPDPAHGRAAEQGGGGWRRRPMAHRGRSRAARKRTPAPTDQARKSVRNGNSVTLREDLGGCEIRKKNKTTNT